MTGQQAITETPIPFAKAAKLLGVSPRSVARFAFDRRRTRRLETIKVGSRYMTTAAACARFLDETQPVEIEPAEQSRGEKAVAAYWAMRRKGRAA
jgi:hypothetical protein